MYFIIKTSKKIIFSLIIAGCAGLTAYGQGIVAPGAKPVVFAPGVVSTPDDEFAPSFTPDGHTVYFSGNPSRIYFSKLVDGKWTKPNVAPFSGHWEDMDPFVSPDGKRLYFSSYRPLANAPQDKPQKFAHIWYIDHLSGDSWSAPHHLDAPVNLEGVNNYAPSISRSGTLCFFSPRRDPRYKRKSYYAKWLGDHYDEPKPLLLNDTEVKDTFIAPDERYILFTSGNDIYISYRKADGWATGQKLDPQVNNGDANGAPYISPDGKMLYYSASHVHGISMIPVTIPQGTH